MKMKKKMIKGRWWSRASKFGAFSGFFMKVIIINNNIKTLHIYYTTYLTYKIIGIIIKKNFQLFLKLH